MMHPLLRTLLIFIAGSFGTLVLGLLTSGIDRKLTARLQWRIGPPILQPFIDMVKLFGRETVVPRLGRRTLFIWAPLLGLAAVATASFLLVSSFLPSPPMIPGDLIVLIYLLTIPAVVLMLGAPASGSPYAAVGASREMNLLMGYELPFLLCMLVAVIHTGGSLHLSSILSSQCTHGSVIMSISGALGAVIALICIQAKVGLVPFDQAEAETEIAGGLLAEYSGPLLAFVLLTRAMMYALLPLLVIVLFWGGCPEGWGSIAILALKYLAIIVLMVLIKNTNPRLRIDQVVGFFWGLLTPLAVAAVVLAAAGRASGIMWF